MNTRFFSLPLLGVAVAALSACAGANARDNSAAGTPGGHAQMGTMAMDGGKTTGGQGCAGMDGHGMKMGMGQGAMSPQQMQQMQGRMTRMHDLMHRAQTAKTPAERQRLEQEQMQLMQQNMQAMMPMMMSMMHGGGMGSMDGMQSNKDSAQQTQPNAAKKGGADAHGQAR